MTLNRHWGYTADSPVYKMTKELLVFLTACASGNGNYLLNVGPKPDGTIPAESEERLRQLGEWLRRYGESVYATERCPLSPGSFGVITQRGKDIYLHVHWWPGAELCLPSIRNRVLDAVILATGQQAEIEYRAGDRIILKGLPAAAPEPYVTVIRLRLDGVPEPGPGPNDGWG